ncbi:MAG TPA: sugar ABC transporter substrate-binding protein [Acidimicrobiales bacterium]|nr:sugar ABC transporter substrate-binding protein [Acidimicrobiales bacterium]
MSNRPFTRREFMGAGAALAAGLVAAKSLRPSATRVIEEARPEFSDLTSSSGPLNVYWGTMAPTSAQTQLFKVFTKATGIKVNPIIEPSDYATFVEKITAALSSGFTGYDVIYYDDFTLKTFGAAGWMVPLDGYVAKSNISALSKAHIDLSSYNGKLYRVPLNQSVIYQFYRKDLLKAAGVGVPTTWAELLSAGRSLTKKGKYGIALTGSPADAFDDFLYYMPQAGGSFLDLESPRTQQALEFMHDLVTTYKVVPPSYVTDSYTNVPTYVEEGYTAIWASWNGFLGTFVSDTKFYDGGKTVGIAKPAKGPVSNITTVGDWGLGVPKFSPRQQEAVKFVTYATTVPSELLLAQTQSVPARQDAVVAAEKVLQNGTELAAILSVTPEAPRPITPEITLIENSVPPILVDYVAGKTSLKTAVQSGQAILKKYS